MKEIDVFTTIQVYATSPRKGYPKNKTRVIRRKKPFKESFFNVINPIAVICKPYPPLSYSQPNSSQNGVTSFTTAEINNKPNLDLSPQKSNQFNQ